MRNYRSTSGVYYEAIEDDPLSSDVIALSPAHKQSKPLKVVQLNRAFPLGLIGRPWDEVALAVLSTLKPSWIRVTECETKTDWRPGRITVYVDKNNVIQGGTIEDMKVAADVPQSFTKDQLAEVQDILNGKCTLFSISGRG